MDASPERQRREEGPVLVRRRPATPRGLHERLKSRLRHGPVCSVQGARRLAQDLLPATRWLRTYRPREDLAGDLMSGLVVGIILVPQAIAYALLAGLQPLYSLYTSFFANLIYFLMGTSRHVSVGIFSLLCLMVGQVVDRELLLAGFDPSQDGPGPRDNSSVPNASAATPALGLQECGRDCYAIRVATALTLVTGIYQVRSTGVRPPDGLSLEGKPRPGPWEDGGFSYQSTGQAQGACPARGSLGRAKWPACGPHGLPWASRTGWDPGVLPAFPVPLHTPPLPTGHSESLLLAPGLPQCCHSWGRRRGWAGPVLRPRPSERSGAWGRARCTDDRHFAHRSSWASSAWASCPPTSHSRYLTASPWAPQ